MHSASSRTVSPAGSQKGIGQPERAGPVLAVCRLSIAGTGIWLTRYLPKEDNMVVPYNGMLAAELGDVRWLKSWHSNPNGECVELAALPSGEIAMRNSRYPAGPVLLYTQAEITAFLAGVKDGAFDHLLAGTKLPRTVLFGRRMATHP